MIEVSNKVDDTGNSSLKTSYQIRNKKSRSSLTRDEVKFQSVVITFSLFRAINKIHIKTHPITRNGHG